LKWAGMRGAVYLALPWAVSGNWLLQCSQCSDQAYYSDDTQKRNMKPLDLSSMYNQVASLPLHQYDHANDEFVNKFFSLTHLGALAADVKSVMPLAVGLVPDRRWIAANGTSQSTKNVNLVRQSYVLYAGLAGLQELMNRYERHEAEQTVREKYEDDTTLAIQKDCLTVLDEQEFTRDKREELLAQILRIAVAAEVLQRTVARGDRRFEELGTAAADISVDVRDLFMIQDEHNNTFTKVWDALETREPLADLVEKRKTAVAQVEAELVKTQSVSVQHDERRENLRVSGEEERKVHEHKDKLNRQRTEYEQKQRLQTERELMDLSEESALRQQADLKLHEVRVLKMRLAADHERTIAENKAALEQTKISAEAAIRDRRVNEDVYLRELIQQGEQESQARLAAIRETAEIIRSYVVDVFTHPERLALAIGSIIAVCAGVYVSREMAILLREQLNKRLGKPSLVRSTNRISLWGEFKLWLLSCCGRSKDPLDFFNDVILTPAMHTQVCRLALASRTAKLRKAPLMNVMFYGPPGTGKTMCAVRYAQASGLEYAIMSGGDVAPLEDQAVTELHKLFSWVHRSRRGVLLFIDEADAFLGARTGNMSEHLRNALTTMLYHTGTPSSQFMLVLATNRPGDLDTAVLDRIDESIEFGLPDLVEREKLVKMYYRNSLTQLLGIALKPEAKEKPRSPPVTREEDSAAGRAMTARGEVTPAVLDAVAKKISGFSGREIAKMFVAVQTHVYATAQMEGKAPGKKGKLELTVDMLMDVVDKKVKEHGKSVDMQQHGYIYRHEESARSVVAASGRPSMPDLVIN